jgi:hypothetical protein
MSVTGYTLRRAPSLVLTVAVWMCAAGCTPTSSGSRANNGASASPSSAATSTLPVTPSAVPPSTVTSATAAAPPTELSAIPAGVYRTSIGTGELVAAGVTDLGNAGVFTLTIKAGSYALACDPAPGTDCGDTAPSQRKDVDVGTLRGTGHRVWLVPDSARKASLTGCVVNSPSETGCGPTGPYSFAWQLTPKGLGFRDFIGLGDQAGGAGGYVNFTFHPWTKIR